MELKPLETISFVALRVVAGLAFAIHGCQKVLGLFATKPGPEIGSQLWIGGVIELVAGTCIALGLLTRPAAFLASGTMAVAYLQFHWKGALGDRILPALNGGELALIYCFLFFFVTWRGGGPWSLDGVIARRRRGAR